MGNTLKRQTISLADITPENNYEKKENEEQNIRVRDQKSLSHCISHRRSRYPVPFTCKNP